MSDLSQYIAEGRAEYLAGFEVPHGLCSSPHYDAKLIVWHFMQAGAFPPKAISTGRGHSYNVTAHDGFTYTARIHDYSDAVNGVTCSAS